MVVCDGDEKRRIGGLGLRDEEGIRGFLGVHRRMAFGRARVCPNAISSHSTSVLSLFVSHSTLCARNCAKHWINARCKRKRWIREREREDGPWAGLGFGLSIGLWAGVIFFLILSHSLSFGKMTVNDLF